MGVKLAMVEAIQLGTFDVPEQLGALGIEGFANCGFTPNVLAP